MNDKGLINRGRPASSARGGNVDAEMFPAKAHGQAKKKN